MKLSRGDFVKGTLAVAGGAFGLASTGCGGGDDTSGNGGGSGSCGASIGANHGHSMTVSQADVDAAQAKTYSIQGTSAHDHQVTITAAQFAELAAGTTVFLTSTTAAGHEHTVDVKCG
jgi:hypothetical protein